MQGLIAVGLGSFSTGFSQTPALHACSMACFGAGAGFLLAALRCLCKAPREFLLPPSPRT